MDERVRCVVTYEPWATGVRYGIQWICLHEVGEAYHAVRGRSSQPGPVPHDEGAYFMVAPTPIVRG
jgi:hypothetical protein